ncbi:uncharacterized protein LOC130902735 isoform X3 [Diorhabda carinulata]|uniref:uncharacterized protein LOC130902735 isoform X3 n=1 Tax=Diorhabda carinulata TaxID=1163345 RepID=UPI0025A13181|nr:uncharacterized protein LOC130902735 isoform X3 [Diorhabda carinulata]
MSKKQSDRQSVPRLPTSSSVFSRKTRKTRKIKIDNERVDRSSYYIAKEPNSRKGILEKFLETLLEDKIQTRFPIVRTTECKFADSLESLIEITCIAKDFRKIQEVDLQSEIIRVDGSKFLLNNSSRQYFKSSIYTGLSLVQETNETTSEKIPDESQSVETVKTTTQSTIMAPPVVEKLEKIIFHNGNIYEGPTNEYLMHGNGKFVWSDNTIYNGEFKDGFITGKGRITLPDLSIYEGEFCNGFFHGKGFLNVASTPVFYSGDWKSDRKDGNGWILYGAGDWYEGEWKMDMRDGKGCRKYKNGAKYIGDWVENKKQGKGKMLFYNDDYYNGGWYDDMLHGYGEYTWDLIDNKTFCFPIYNWYKGAWKNGVREGIGIMNFGTECGAKYAGTWRNNIKHGPGVMICGNGLILESNPLFEYDKPIHKNSQISLTQLGVENRFSDFIIQKSSYYDILELINSQIACDELDEVILVKITVKSQYIPSNMFVKINNSISDSKKIWCPLYIPTHTTAEDVDLKYFVDLIFEDIKNTSEENFTKLFEGLIDRRRKSIVPRSRNSSLSKSVDYSPELNDPLEKIKLIKAKELKKLKNSIIIYLPKLKMIYATFAKSKSILGDINLDFKPVLVRFFLWQLLRDLRVTEDGVELVDIDSLLWDNPVSCLDNEHYPFEPIYFYQFVMYIFGAAWLCFKIQRKKFDDEIIEKKIPSSIFRQFLDTRLDSAEMLRGSSFGDHLNVVPINNLYDIFINIAEPMTVKSFLNATYRSEEEELPCYYTIYKDNTFKKNVREGYNAVAVAHDVHFIREAEAFNESRRESAKQGDGNLFTFRTLGKNTILETVTKICPKFNPKNMSYKISFLEFFEIVISLAFEKAEEDIRKDQMNVNKITTTMSEISYKTKMKKKKTKN